MPGLFITSSALSISSSVCLPDSYGMPHFSRSVVYLPSIRPLSERKTSNPLTFARTAAPAPLSPPPRTTILFMIFLFLSFNLFLPLSSNFYRTIFIVQPDLQSGSLMFRQISNLPERFRPLSERSILFSAAPPSALPILSRQSRISPLSWLQAMP